VLQCGPPDLAFKRPALVCVAQLLETRNIFSGKVVSKEETFTQVETPCFRAGFTGGRGPRGRRHDGDLCPPAHLILLRRDRPRASRLGTTFDVEIMEEDPTGNNHRLSLRVVGAASAAECIIEIDVSAHPYEVMGVATHRDWRVAPRLEETIAIPT
jgi:ABC-type Fe3+/spermidine/putrescine transport system ATPase subunit